MKSIKNIYYTACLTGLLALSTSSCTDWLTIYPQDRVVEENFWEDKNDLEGVRYAAYRQMASTVSSLVLWGDLRSDSFKENGAFRGNMDTHNMYIEIISGMPDSSMGVFDWSGVYTTINYCNKVLQHGEEVLAKDKQFTSGEWYQMRAEMKALRALNYFYLIRAFKDVPYTTKVINKDSEVEHFPLTNQLAVLDSIINDCESVQGQARNRFSDIRDTKGLITNSAIYAMLADMYLWRGSLHEGRHGKKGKDLVNGTPIRQDFLRKALEWMAAHETRQGHRTTIVSYMADHQHDPNANNLWSYFQQVLNWTITNFDMKKFKKIMKGLDLALFYDRFHDTALDTVALAKQISTLMRDSEVQNPHGIIPYVLTGDERSLDLRAFPEDIKLAVWEKQQHICPHCGKEFDYEFMEGDHITPWRDGGRTVIENCQMLCKECNRRKGAK